MHALRKQRFTDPFPRVGVDRRYERETPHVVSTGEHGETETALRYVRRHYITRDNLRRAITRVVNTTFDARDPRWWGTGTACASDSRKFGSWESNLMTEWHNRYGGPGVMIYRHVERRSMWIYSQLKNCSSSEVAAMIEGLLRHDTDVPVENNYVDTHGASIVGFAFTELLGFRLLPRLKNIGSIRLYRPDDTIDLKQLEKVTTRPIRWDLIAQQYDQMIRYATALRLGTTDAETILRRFTRGGPKHPTYQALEELGPPTRRRSFDTGPTSTVRPLPTRHVRQQPDSTSHDHPARAFSGCDHSTGYPAAWDTDGSTGPLPSST